MDFINFNNSRDLRSSYNHSIDNPNTLYLATNGSALVFNGKYYGVAYLSGNISISDNGETLTVQDIRPYNNSNINNFTSNSLTLTPGGVYIYNSTSGLSSLSITINPGSLLLSHYKIILKTATTTATTFLTANYSIILPPNCLNKLDGDSIYEIDLELVKVAGSYKLMTVISKFS